VQNTAKHINSNREKDIYWRTTVCTCTEGTRKVAFFVEIAAYLGNGTRYSDHKYVDTAWPRTIKFGTVTAQLGQKHLVSLALTQVGEAQRCHYFGTRT